MNFQMFKLDLEKTEEPEIKLPTSVGSSKKQESSRKTSAWLTTPKPLTVWITTNFGKFLKRWEYQTTLPVSWEICMQVKKQQNWTWNNRLEKEYVKPVYCYPAYLTYMQNISCEMLVWNKHELDSRLQEKYPQICRWHHPYGRKWIRTKEPLDESERGEWKSWLKTQHSEN